MGHNVNNKNSNDMGEKIDQILEGYYQKEYDLLEVRKKLLILFSVSGSYSIDFGKHCKAKIQIKNGEPKVEAAMNGWGDGISLSDIIIEKL